MSALLAALETDPRVRVRRTVAAVAVLACLGVTVVAVRRVAGSQAAMCQGGVQRLAGIWEPHGSASARKDEIHRAFAATGRSYAQQAFTGVVKLLDQYSDRWLGMYAETCQATQLRGDQSAEVMDLRMGCLQERLVSVRALVDVFTKADGTVVENAVSAAGSLPQLDRCADVTLLRAVVKPPQDESMRRRVEELRGEVARLDALRDAGHCAEARTLADGLLTRVRKTAYLPLLADTLNSAAYLGDACGDSTQAVPRYREAYGVGLAAHHDEAAARAATIVSGVLFDRLGHHEEGRQWLEIARAMIARIGGNPLLESWLLTSEAAILDADRGGNSGAETNEKARIIKEKLLGKDHPDALRSLGNKGTSLLVAGRYHESLAASTAAADGWARVVGPSHPMLAICSNNIGEALNGLHRYAEARAAFGRALDIWHESGADPFLRAYGLFGEGLALLGEGKPDQAVAPLSEALRIRLEKQAAPERMGEVRFALARALWFQPAERERARALALKARADYAQVTTARPTLAAIDAWLRAPSSATVASVGR
jgi:serine/threonine-protein kinase